MLGCMHALLLVGATSQLIHVRGGTAPQGAEIQGQPTTAELVRQHAASPQPAASPAAPPAAGEPAANSPASLPLEIYHSAKRGELQKVAKWLRKGGPVDALYSFTTEGGLTVAFGLLYAAAAFDQLEMVKMLLKRGASVNLPNSLGSTALMIAAAQGHLSIMLFLLHHSANPDLQSNDGGTALMAAADQRQGASVQALLRAKADTELLDKDGRTALQHAEAKGHTAIVQLIRQHEAPPKPAASPAASPAAPPDAGEPAASSPTSLPLEMYDSAGRGELQKVAKWLRKGGPVDALCPVPTDDNLIATVGLLHVAARDGQLEMAKMLLKRGASVDLQDGLGATALIIAAYHGHLSIVLLLLQHSANPDLQGSEGNTALITATYHGQEACVQALLRAGADTELLDKHDRTALWWAEDQGHTATAKLLRHASCLSLGLGVALCAVVPLTWPWVVLSVVVGAIATVAFSRTLITVGPGQRRAARQRRPHRPAQHARDQGRTTTAEPTQQRAAPQQPVARVAPHAMQAAQAARAARADAAMEQSAAEAQRQSAEERACKEKKRRCAEAKAAAKEAKAREELAARQEAKLAAAREAEVQASHDREAAAERRCTKADAQRRRKEEKARRHHHPQETRAGRTDQEPHCTSTPRLQHARAAAAPPPNAILGDAIALALDQHAWCKPRGASERARAESERAREELEETLVQHAIGLTSSLRAEAPLFRLERRAKAGGVSSRRVAGPSEASEAAVVPDDYICPITAEVMTDPVTTADGFTYERTAISEWFRTKDTSPSTGATLENKTVFPNLSLRSMIRSFTEARAVAAAALSLHAV